MGGRRNLAQHREWIVERLRAGATLRDVAEQLGCHHDTVRQQAAKAGYRKRRSTIEYEGELLNFAELSERTGIGAGTLWMRYQSGKRGKELVEPLHIGKCKEHVYELGLSVEVWEQVAQEARARGVRGAYNKFRLPYGAISAAMRGEWERLG